jgi:hypothetical protein
MGGAFSTAFRAARGGGAEGIPGQQSFGGAAMAGARAAIGTQQMSWSQAALVTIGGIQRYAQRQEQPALATQFAANMATLQGGPGAPVKWSQGYRDRMQNTIAQAGVLGATREERAQMAVIAQRAGLQVGTGGGRNLTPIFRTAAGMAAMTGTTPQAQMGVQANMQQPGFVNVTRMLGVQVRPGGQQKTSMEVYKQLRDYIYRPLGRNPTAEEVRLTLRTPGTPSNVLVQQIFQGNSDDMEAFISWVENSAAGGKDVTAGNVMQTPGAQTTANVRRRRVEQEERRRAETDVGVLQGMENMDNVVRNLNDTFADLLGTLGPLPDLFGQLGGMLARLPGIGGGGGGGGGILQTAAGLVLGKGALSLGAKALGGTAVRGAASAIAGSAALPATVAVVGGAAVWNARSGAQRKVTGARRGAEGRLAEMSDEQLYEQWAQHKKSGAGNLWDVASSGVFGETTPITIVENELEARGLKRPGNKDEARRLAGTGDPVSAWGWMMYGGDVGDAPPTGGTAQSLRGKGQTQGMNADFVARLARMFTDNPKLSLTSGYRSTAEQQRLYDLYKAGKGNLAAAPGKSKHEKGLAADVGPPSEYGWLAQNVAKYGLGLPIGNIEPWHVEPTGGVAGGAVAATDAALATDAGAPGGGGGGGGTTGAAITGGLAGPSIFGLGGPSLLGGSGGFAGTTAVGGGSAAGAGAAGGGGPSINVPTAGTISVEQALRLAKSAGFSGSALQTIVAIAMGESGLRPDAKGDINLQDAKWGPSVGLWQVRTLKADTGQGTTRDIQKLLADPNFQAKAAWDISGGGRNFQPWSVWKSGKHTQHMPVVQQAMQQHGIGDPPVGEGFGRSTPVVSIGGAAPAGGGPAPIIIQQANFTAQIARGTPEEAERFARYVMETLGNRDRLLQIGGGRG